MRALLLMSAFDGPGQRAGYAVREVGHDVGVLPATGPHIIDGLAAARPELTTRALPMRAGAPGRSRLHTGPVADAACTAGTATTGTPLRVRSAVPLSA